MHAFIIKLFKMKGRINTKFRMAVSGWRDVRSWNRERCVERGLTGVTFSYLIIET